MLEIKVFKKLAFFAVALAGLASCTSSDELGSIGDTESSKTPITFDVPFIGKSSRVSNGDWGLGPIDNDNVSSTARPLAPLYGEKYKTGEGDCETVFQGDEMSCTKGIWTSRSTQYWEKGYTYDFTVLLWGGLDSFGHQTYNMSANLSERKLTLNNVSLIQYNQNGAEEYAGDNLIRELLVGTATGYDGSNPQAVQLTCHHIYSLLNVYAYTTTGTTTSISDLNIWLPKTEDNTFATYTQKEHGKVEGDWSWTNENVTSNPEATTESDLTTYTKYSLLNGGNWSGIKNATNANEAIDVASTRGNKSPYISPVSLYIAPTPESLIDYTPYLGITFTVDGEEKTKLIKLDINKFEQGKKYNIALCLDKKEEIKFELNINDWTPSQVEKDLTK